MKTMYLKDEQFLKQLDLCQNKEVFARITSLTFDELPVEWIEGKVQNSGSINVDGNSAIRRTCSLSLLAENVDINEYNWGLNHKFKLEIGLTNTIDSEYPDICWFKQGIYVITGFSCNISNNNYSISINGKDKGCMLNGEVGGQLPASIDFGKIENYEEFYEEVKLDADTYETNKYYIKEALPDNYDDVIGKLETQVWDYIKEYRLIIWNQLKPYLYTSVKNSIETLIQYKNNPLLEDDWDTIIQPHINLAYAFVFDIVSKNIVGLGPDANNKLVVELFRLKGKTTYQLATGPFDSNAVYYMKSHQLYMDKIPIKTIIREAVHTYAREPYSNIIINDLDDYGMELMEYKGENPMYLTHRIGAEVYGQMVQGTQACRKLTGDCAQWNQSTITAAELGNNYSEITQINNLNYDTSSDDLIETLGDRIIKSTLDGGPYKVFTVRQLTNGETPGYKITPLVYPGELISGIGETLSSVLDKIKNMLTAFEYFYDLDGRFVFQKKQLFTMTSWNNIVDDKKGQRFVNPAMLSSPYYYVFEDNMIVTAFNNSPNLNNLRNDYSVWGKRKTSTGAEVPIHMRLAFDAKPKCYRRLAFTNPGEITELQKLYPTIFTAKGIDTYMQTEETYFANDVDLPDGYSESQVIRYDWRELIYRMALDYYKYGQMEDFGVRLAEANRELWDLCNDDPAAANPYNFYKTGYEQYYVDLEGFWRQLYNPDALIQIDKDNVQHCDYYKLVENNVTTDFETTDSAKANWNTNVFNYPELLNFWFDLYDDGEMYQYRVSAIGQRPKVVNDTNVKAIYYRDTPTVIFTTAADYKANIDVINTGYRYVFITQAMEDQLFRVSSQGKSAKDAIDDLLYTNAYCVESVSLTTFPIYYLEPNVYVYIKDEKSGINGQYSITKFSIPLTYNGTMSITATKAVNRII